MAIKSHVVQTTFQAGELDKSFSQRLDLDLVKTGVKQMFNWLPTNAGSAVRRPATEMIGDWGISLTADALYIPMRLISGRTDIIVVRERDPVIEFQRINTSTGVVSLIGNQTITSGEPSLPSSWAQAGQSLFFAYPRTFSGVQGLNRIINTDESAVILETSEDMVFYRELQGLWSLNVTNDDTRLFSLQSTGALGPGGEELVGADVLLIGDLEVGLSTVTEDVSDPDNPETVITLDVAFTGASFAGSRIYVKMRNTGAGLNREPVASVVDFYKQRLVLANVTQDTATEGLTRVLLSEPGNIFNIIPGSVEDDSALDLPVFARSAEKFIWGIADKDSLFLASEVSITATSNVGQITPTTAAFGNAHSRGGELRNPPIKDDNRFLYVPQGIGSIHELVFDFNSQSFSAENLSRFAPSSLLTVKRIGIKQANTLDPLKRIYGVLTDGTLTVGSDILERFPSWASVKMAPRQAGIFRFVDVVTLGEDIFFIIERTDTGQIALATFRSESFTEDFVLDIQETQGPIASTVNWTTTNTAMFNESIFVVVDGVGKGFVDVDGTGKFVTPVAGTRVQYGFVFDSSLELFSPFASDEQGSSQTRKTANVRNIIRVEDTRQLNINGEPLFSTVPPTPGGERPSNSAAEVKHELGWDREHELVITNQDAYNAQVLSVSRELVI